MTNRNHTAGLQDDRLAREFPGTLDRNGNSLLPKLGVAVVLGIVLAAIGGLTEDRPRLTEVEQLATPGTAGPPEIVFQNENSDRTRF
jgi:hypothetical protein